MPHEFFPIIAIVIPYRCPVSKQKVMTIVMLSEAEQ